VTSLRLRPLTVDDEDAVMEGQRVMAADGFVFALGYDDAMSWTDYLQFLEARRHSVDVTDEAVPGTFLVAEVNREIVGRVSIRHVLNAFLLHEGGHIGFGVLPGHRRQGYASEILRQSLQRARNLGIVRVLVTCDDDNVGSAAVIEGAGGVLGSVVDSSDGRPVRRYWIG
jgi:predicted acetyltransferase